MAGGQVKKILWEKPVLYFITFVVVLVLLQLFGFISVVQAASILVTVLSGAWDFLKALGQIAKETVAQWKATH